jgi:hypothetical protein
MDDFEFVDRILHRPRMHFGSAGSLRDVLAIMYVFSLVRYPPNGYGFLPGFPEFVGFGLTDRLPVITRPFWITSNIFPGRMGSTKSGSWS